MRRLGIAVSFLVVGTLGCAPRSTGLPAEPVRPPASDRRSSKQAESKSIRIAHREFERLTGLPERQQYDSYRCEFWFYDTLADGSNFAKLTEADRKALKATVGDAAFFLHRFTPKGAGDRIHEVFVSEDGTTVVGAREVDA